MSGKEGRSDGPGETLPSPRSRGGPQPTLPVAALLLPVTTACSGPGGGYGASDATEGVLVMLGAAEMNSSFEFFDAADGCPS